MRIKFLFLFFLFNIFPLAFATLKVGFYKSTCPQAESIILRVVQNHFKTDRSITAALLRMHFHDCFTTGCDASILIDSTRHNQAEKDAGPNQTVRGFELIDEAKKALEAACPSIVSCADIITLATRDSVALAGGPNYSVPTGRRDGLISKMDDVELPGPSFTVSEALEVFRDKRLTLNDMVTLLGAHTVGVSHCSLFQDRLDRKDPSMDANLAANLRKICASGSDPTVFLDQNTSFAFDNEFYKQIRLKRGILQIDQELATDNSSAGLVLSLARNDNGFKQNFAKAMVKMGSIQVLVGKSGQVRKNCRVFNTKKKSEVSTSQKKDTVSNPKNSWQF